MPQEAQLKLPPGATLFKLPEGAKLVNEPAYAPPKPKTEFEQQLDDAIALKAQGSGRRPTFGDYGTAALDLLKGAGKSAVQPLAMISKGISKIPVVGEHIVSPAQAETFQQDVQPRGIAQQVGAMIETGAEMAMGEGLVKQALMKIPALAKYAPLVRIVSSSAAAGAPAAVRGENPAIPAAIGAVGAGVSEALPVVKGFLEKSAEKNYKAVLNPTKEATKFQTQKIMPELLAKRPVAATRAGLAEKAAQRAEQFGIQIEEKVSGMTGSLNTMPVIDGLKKLSGKFKVNGVSLRPEADKAIQDGIEQIQAMSQAGQFSGIGAAPPVISYQDAIKARRILDQAVSEAGGYVGKSISDTSLTSVRKETANAIRSELAKASPDLAALNAKFHFWNTLTDVLEQTIKRKTGQAGTGLLPTIETTAAGAAGLMQHGLQGGAGYAGVVWALGKTVRSTGWRTVSANVKLAIADALAARNFDKAVSLITKAGAAEATQKSP